MQRRKKCEHMWELVEKHIDGKGNQIWEFYCKYCLEIQIKFQKRGERTEVIYEKTKAKV